ncbi:BTB/POZ domain-containing protein [Heracleum sosnowskyi]|uniref:BTB/POZ domain-containing protein n=1 Tax=Heracleum sosnowskyi TaxID=360622 RepID=A0AAD8LX06_9APIA|nr:BTB/POZ domain-containing protein [Heracleum sosnowskyi]
MTSSAPINTPSRRSKETQNSPNKLYLLFSFLSLKTVSSSPHLVLTEEGDRERKEDLSELLAFTRYLNRKLRDSNEVELPKDFPGGPKTFEMIALFIYGASTLVNPFNVAALRCAAEFLELREEHNSRNLCERFDIYLNQVALQNWNDTLIVLRKCETLLPWAEELRIVSRCIESLAFMACMEILDPERRRDQPVVTLEALASQAWSLQIVEEIVDVWIKDLIALPFRFFERIIKSLRRQGMREKYVAPIILFYANKWVLSIKPCNFCESSGDTNSQSLDILQGVVNLLPISENASKIIPVGFYFSLLSKCLELGLTSGTIIAKLKGLIVSLLNTAFVEDFLLPTIEKGSFSSSFELATMESIISSYVSVNIGSNNTPLPSKSIVAELWDMYLGHIATDPAISFKRFMDLIEIGQNHDYLYRALNTFLQGHLDLSEEEREMICKDLKCQKMSQEICVEVVQNELMPLRLIVQALYVQQRSTHQALKDCSDSFRYTVSSKFSESLSRSQILGASPYVDGEETCSRTLSYFLQRDFAIESSEVSMNDYKLTTCRIQNIEQELVTLKEKIEVQNFPKRINKPTSENLQSLKPYCLGARTLSKKRKPTGHMTGCIGSLNFTSQRKCANSLLKVFKSLHLLGSKKLKKKPRAPSLWSK